jgi:hypothetical protein
MQTYPTMKYSLKTLMILLTLFAAVLGGRTEYLRRRAEFHEEMAEQQAATIRGQSGLSGLEFMLRAHGTMNSGNPTTGCFVNEQHRLYVRHQDLAEEYRRAVVRPWTIVRESPF